MTAGAGHVFVIGVDPAGCTGIVTDSRTHKIQSVDVLAAKISPIAGSTLGYADGIGTNAKFKMPEGVALINNGGTALVADTGNNRIRRVDGIVPTLCSRVYLPLMRR